MEKNYYYFERATLSFKSEKLKEEYDADGLGGEIEDIAYCYLAKDIAVRFKCFDNSIHTILSNDIEEIGLYTQLFNEEEARVRVNDKYGTSNGYGLIVSDWKKIEIRDLNGEWIEIGNIFGLTPSRKKTYK